MARQLCAAVVIALAGNAGAQELYFADIFSPTALDGSIKRTDLSGSVVEPLVTTGGGLRAVAVDGTGGKIYWCDSDLFKISRANLDGTGQEDLVTSGLQFPTAVALDLVHQKLYWGDQTAEEIHRCNLDGSNQEFIVSTPFHRGLAVDTLHGKLFWTTSRNPNAGDVWTSDLDGNGAVVVLNGGTASYKPATIAVDPQRNRLYFSDYVTDTLRRSALDGSGLTTLYTDQFGLAPRGVAVNPLNGDVYWGRDTGFESVAGEIDVAIGGEASFGSVVFGLGEVLSISFAIVGGPPVCYANCDQSTTAPVLNVLDFSCFLNRFAAGDTYANCDNSTTPPVLNVLDFSCFLNKFAAGCS
jgi:sugar lactone lactonase YvrE